MTAETPATAVNYRELMKKVEQVVSGLARSEETGRTVHTVAELSENVLGNVLSALCDEIHANAF